MFYKLLPLVELDIFYGKVIFGNLCFSIVKSEKVDILEMYAASGMKTGRCRQLIQRMEVSEYCKSWPLTHLGPKLFTYENYNLLFSETIGPCSTKFCM